MDNVVVELTSEKRYTGREQYHTIPKVVCKEYNLELTGFGMVVTQMASLLAQNKCHISRGYEVVRGGTLCFKVVPLKSWLERAEQPEHLRGPRGKMGGHRGK